MLSDSLLAHDTWHIITTLPNHAASKASTVTTVLVSTMYMKPLPSLVFMPSAQTCFTFANCCLFALVPRTFGKKQETNGDLHVDLREGPRGFFCWKKIRPQFNPAPPTLSKSWFDGANNLIYLVVFNSVLSQHPSPGFMTTLAKVHRLQALHKQGTISRILCRELCTTKSYNKGKFLMFTLYFII